MGAKVKFTTQAVTKSKAATKSKPAAKPSVKKSAQGKGAKENPWKLKTPSGANVSSKNLYDQAHDEKIKAKALEWNETETDLKYKKKYEGVWRGK